MRTFDSLDADFRRAFKQAAKQGIVKFTIEGIKDDPESIYPMFEVSNNHVTYYSVQRQESVCITAVSYTHLDVYKRQHVTNVWVVRLVMLQVKDYISYK